MITYIYAFNIIKLSLLKNNKIVELPCSKKIKTVLEIFLKYNIILGYVTLHYKNKSVFKVFLNNSINFKNLQNFCKPSNPVYVKYKTIIKLSNRYTRSNYIIMTSNGFLNFEEAFKKKTGGVLLWKIK